MSAFEVGSDERVLFALTHPDDEIAIAAFIWRLVKQGTPVRMLWTHSTPVRKAESLSAMREIGVQEECLTFFGAPDGGVVSHLGELRGPISEIVRDFRPTRVVTHAFEQGHIDHDATNLLANLCYDGAVYEMPCYYTYLTRFPKMHCFSTSQGAETMELSADERAMKGRLVRMYPSQTLLRNVMAYQLLYVLTLRRPPLLVAERLRLQTHKDFMRPNHPEPLAGRVAKSSTWRRWVREASPHL